MTLSEISVRRPVATSMFFLAVVILGIISVLRLPVDLLPDISYPKLTVWTSYPNIPPVEIEELLTVQIEEVVSTIPRVRRVNSVSREGVSLVMVEFLWGTDMDIAALNIREKLDNLRWTLPRESGRPTILRLDPRSRPVMALSVAGENLVQLKEFCRNVIKRRLEQIKGVALAAITGGFEREIQVEVNEQKLTALGLSIEQVASALANANRNLPGGTIKKGRYRYALRTLGEFEQVQDMQDVVVANNGNGSVISLKDIATVVDGFKERESITRFNGNEAIGVIITKEAGANTVEVSKQVRAVLGILRQEFPGVQIAVAADQAQFISEAITSVLQAVLLGGILSFLVLFLFLQDLRNPIIIAVAIPIAILAAFALMFFSGVSLNMISLGGLALGVGMLVDNSIVVLENIFRHREEGVDPAQSCVLGAKEVAMPVLASTLTTISVFFPIIFVKGVAGQLFHDQSLTVTFALLASLAVSLTLLPMLAARFPGRRKKSLLSQQNPARTKTRSDLFNQQAGSETFVVKSVHSLSIPFRLVGNIGVRISTTLCEWSKDLINYWRRLLSVVLSKATRPTFRTFDRAYQRFAHKYESILAWSLHNRSKVILLATLVFVISGLAGATLDRKLLPKVNQDECILKVELPTGSSLEATGAVVSEIEQILLQHNDIASVFSQMGLAAGQFVLFVEESGLNRAKIRVRLRSTALHRAESVVADLRQRMNTIAGCRLVFESGGSLLTQFLGTADADIGVKISGNDLAMSKKLLQQVKAELENVAGVIDLHSSYEEGRPEIRISIDREAAGRFGFTARQVAQFVQNRMYGAVSTQYKDFDRKINILVRPNVEARDELSDLLAAQIKRGDNRIPLRRLISAERTQGHSEIRREDQVRQVALFANIQGRGFSEVVQEIDRRLESIKHPFDFQLIVGGPREEMLRSFQSMILVFLLAAVLVYMILAAQFESLLHPFVIIFTVPLALIGVVWALLLSGQSLNIMSLIGIVVLTGIVVNDAIIKVDFINKECRRGVELQQAILAAGRKRLRPILMTTVTTVLGLLPMAFGFGGGGELRRPLAVAVIGGLLSATLLTLVVVPVIYTMFARNEINSSQ